MITLSSSRAHAVVDLDRGAEVRHFGPDHLTNALAAFDWVVPRPASAGPSYGSSKDDWHSEYRGGWQLATPNAGPESVVDGTTHPYHGEVSRSRWVCVEHTQRAVTAQVGTHGPLTVTRRYEIDGDRCRITAQTTLENPTPVAGWAVLVEHIAFPGGNDVRVVAPVDSEWAPAWQDRTRDESVATRAWDADTMGEPVASPGSKLLTLRRGGGWIELHRPASVVRVEWDPTVLPSLWYWQERHSSHYPWFGRADIIGLEPASVAFPHGLSEAVQRGSAYRIGPGERISTCVSVEMSART